MAIYRYLCSLVEPTDQNRATAYRDSWISKMFVVYLKNEMFYLAVGINVQLLAVKCIYRFPKELVSFSFCV